MTAAQDGASPTAVASLQHWHELERRGAELSDRVGDLLGAAPEFVDNSRAEGALACMHAITDRLPRGPAADVRTALALLADLQELVFDLQEHHTADRLRRIAGCERGLERLRRLTSQAELIDRVCDELARSGGFGRVLLSRVQEGMWSPWTVNSSTRGQDWVAHWQNTPIPLEELELEHRVVQEGRPGLMGDVASAAVHDVFRQTQTTSYVVAPIMPAGRVIGLLHADRVTGGRSCGETDRDMVFAFADGFGRLYERTELIDRCRRQRLDAHEALQRADGALRALSEFELELELAVRPDDDSWGSASPSSTTISSGELERLTPRELDVLRLVAQGASNREIAEDLTLALATVKTHVNHLLAKLGVSNRSQAIVRYRRAEAGRRDVGGATG